jgi:hypothetical protein
MKQVRVDLNSVMLNVDEDELAEIKGGDFSNDVMGRILIAIKEEGKHVVCSIEEED